MLTCTRWENDSRSTGSRHTANGGSSIAPAGGGDDFDDDDHPPDVETAPNQPKTRITQPYTRPLSHPQPQPQPVNSHMSTVPEILPPETRPSSSGSRTLASNHTSPADPPPANVPVPHHMLTACLQLLQAQVQHSKLKLDYLRKREEREEKESVARREIERLRLEREQAEWEHNKESVKMKQRAQLATDLLSNPVVDGSVRQAAMDYLKKLFAD